MTELNTSAYPSAQVSTKSRFSLIWIIPITAALIGGWLTYKYYTERGTFITIIFDNAAGIEKNKTPVRYKDVQVGKVKKLSLTADLKKVKVTAEIYPGMAEYLGGDTRFWVVSPRITFQGISGIETLLSGVHIGIDPGKKGTPLEEYHGLSNPPLITTEEKGTRISLKTDSLGSLDIGSPIYYHKINVGEVTSYKLNPQNGSINIFIYVHKPYDNKIKTNTRFWNASGLEVNLDSAGVSARMESLTSLLIGGIAFETPSSENGKELNGETTFTLYDTYKLAKDDTQRNNKLFYTMYFKDTLHGLSEDSLVEYGGVKVGKVEKIQLEKKSASPQFNTVVKTSFRIDKFSKKGDILEAKKVLKNLISHGLHAQLTTDSLVTGSQYISLVTVDTATLNDTDPKPTLASRATSDNQILIFPTTAAQVSLLSFDATEITQELNKAISSATAIINSDDIKMMLTGLANTSDSISKITQQLDKKGFSNELVDTLVVAQQTTQELSKLIQDTRKTMASLTKSSETLQKDASLSMKTFNNISNKLEQKLGETLGSINKTSSTLNKGLKATLSEDSALQYRLQRLINDLSQAAKSFSVLTDTLQRKPNAIILGK